ncbi:hypothetical protein [Leptolyngbya sp. 7M]|uniref:hypothetical protein n=1 Tax=Leptolyngbya sp. 7M TaxID=2812896 RepID=UPI001B8CBE4D|nr:hypothetical protein [Leptolyngbya sp. 7M]QYO67530.1 hypothetical protein JVX88_12480 [Leptolyngbya sp. 7M]
MTLNGTNQANFVDVNGIHFETVVPQRNITLPARGSKTQVRFDFGIRITNHTPEMQRFLLFFIRPQFLYADGTPVWAPMGANYNQVCVPSLLDFQALEPGQHLIVSMHGSFHRRRNQVWFYFLAKDGGSRDWGSFDSGEYLIQVLYENRYATWEGVVFSNEHGEFAPSEKCPDSLRSRVDFMSIENVWVGEVATPLVEFNLN